MLYCLHFIKGNNKGEKIIIREDSMLMGRDTECDIHIWDEKVSRIHCMIEKREDKYFLKDLYCESIWLALSYK